jgi:outer membrane protein assembly factor BamA
MLAVVSYMPAQNYKPRTMVFTGAEQYKAADLIAVTGLTPGKIVSAGEIDTAMQHLVDTGLFSDMRYTVNDQALTFALTGVPASDLRPARYSNFLWWKQDELTPLVHAKIPLFTGLVPVTGTMKDAIETTLAALVAEKGVKASVTSIASSGVLGKGSGPVVVFSIAQPTVQIGEIHIEQVSAPAATMVEGIRKRYVGEEYSELTFGDAIAVNLRDGYLDLGFLDIAIDPPVRGTPQLSAMAITVDLTDAVHEGEIYHVSRIAWPESAIVSKAECAKVATLKENGVASRIERLSSVAQVERRYAAMGYIDAKLSQTEEKDSTAHKIAYAFSVVPGDQYKFAAVKAVGLNASQQADFDKAWLLAPGQNYNEDLVKESVQKAMSKGGLQGYAVGLGKSVDRAAHTVSVTVTFKKA